MVCSPHTLFICSVSCLDVFLFVLFYEGFHLHYLHSTFISISFIYYEPLWAIQLTLLFYILIKLGNMCDKNIVFAVKTPNILYRKYIKGMIWFITSYSTVVSSKFIPISRSSLFLVLPLGVVQAAPCIDRKVHLLTVLRLMSLGDLCDSSNNDISTTCQRLEENKRDFAVLQAVV